MPGPDYERFDGKAFLAAIEAKRDAEGLTWTALSKLTGVSPPTIKRFGKGQTIEADGVFALVRWLERPLEDFSQTNAHLRAKGFTMPNRPRTMLRRDTQKLHAALSQRAEEEGRKLPELAGDIGLSAAQLRNMQAGGRTDIRTFLRVTEYLSASFLDFTHLTDH